MSDPSGRMDIQAMLDDIDNVIDNIGKPTPEEEQQP
jgi:hypothetical protein